MDGFHLKKGEEKMFNKRLLKTFKAEMKNVMGSFDSMVGLCLSYSTDIFT